MSLPPALSVALKEWAVLDSAIESGRQIVLLRKGGISESTGGFQLEHHEFLIFPTYVHQNAAMLKTPWAGQVKKVDAEPGSVRITTAAEITDIIRIKDRRQIAAIDDHHIWLPALIDMRFNYKPENPLYLILLRAARLSEPVTIRNTPAYAGCKSWVPLDKPVSISAATFALSDSDFNARRVTILERLSQE
jgi:hypothetical protein